MWLIESGCKPVGLVDTSDPVICLLIGLFFGREHLRQWDLTKSSAICLDTINAQQSAKAQECDATAAK